MKQIFLLLVIAVGLMTSCLGKLEENAKVTDIVSVGQRLPDFTVTTSDSSLVSSGNLRGHASVIVFSAPNAKIASGLCLRYRTFIISIKRVSLLCV